VSHEYRDDEFEMALDGRGTSDGVCCLFCDLCLQANCGKSVKTDMLLTPIPEDSNAHTLDGKLSDDAVLAQRAKIVECGISTGSDNKLVETLTLVCNASDPHEASTEFGITDCTDSGCISVASV